MEENTFRGLVHNHHDRKQTGMALEQYLGALHPDRKEVGKKREGLVWAFETSKPNP